MTCRLLGITGGIGSGKTTATKLLAAALDATVVDADQIAREVVAKGSPVLAQLQAAFGADVVQSDGNLDRKLLASRAFVNEAATAKLNSITHGEIRKLINQRIAAAKEAGATEILLDHPLLFEQGGFPVAAAIVVVADLDVRLQRLIEQRGISREDATNRIAAQLSDDERRQRADYVLDNSGSLAQLTEQVAKLAAQLKGD